MCRLFGFHSITKSQVHRSLVAADNALVRQSKAHPHGWGIAYYLRGIPHVFKSLNNAHEDHVFTKLGESLSAHTVIAHVRKATRGDISLVNCHPFQYGNWIMAHNGDMPQFDLVRGDLVELIDREFLHYIFGSTDSEIYFALYLSELARLKIINDDHPSVDSCAVALRNTIEKIRGVYRKRNISEPVLLNTIISNGRLMLGLRSGKELSFSIHKTSCAEVETCAFYREACLNEVKAEGQTISHLLISSEPLQGENVFKPVEEGQIVAVDHELRFFREL